VTNDQAQAATITTPSDREIHIERIFDAPRDRVFAVYTDPALISEWWGPRGTATIVDQMDLRPGGSFTTSLFHTTERDGMLNSGMEGGLNETYARLDELLARLAGS
jgi:Activator of Hsp90 ATPase homolog 1-like protein